MSNNSNRSNNSNTQGLLLSNARIVIVSILLMIAAVVSYGYVGNVADVPIKKSLSSFPRQVGSWRWVSETSIDQAAREMLAVDDYIQYDYAGVEGGSANLYVSYFCRTGSAGKGYHSPKNCMPGSGWDVIDSKPLKLRISHSSCSNRSNVSNERSDRTFLTVEHSAPVVVEINRMTMQKGAERLVVFYWYQCRGRIIHSEYMEKIYLVLDSMFKHRSDGAFVRIMAPVENNEEAKTVQYLKDFTTQVIPMLGEYLPGG